MFCGDFEDVNSTVVQHNMSTGQSCFSQCYFYNDETRKWEFGPSRLDYRSIIINILAQKYLSVSST